MASAAVLGPVIGAIITAVCTSKAGGALEQSAPSDKGPNPYYWGGAAVLVFLLVSFGGCVWMWWALRKSKIAEFEASRIRMIQPSQYAAILRQLAETHGPGDLLLFNVELNSFTDNRVFESFWQHLAEIKDVRSVRLALPPHKFERWERIVTGVRDRFFADRSNGDKFIACRYEVDASRGEDRIAFALYATSDGRPHDWGALFLINRPFVEQRDGVYQYLHILEYKGRHDMLDRCRALWDKVYDPQWAETATGIRAFAHRMDKAVALDELLAEHHCDERRAELMRRVVAARRVIDPANRNPQPTHISRMPRGADGRAGFVLTYRYEHAVATQPESVNGHVLQLPDDPDAAPRPCVIWAGGFGEGEQPDWTRLLSRRLKYNGTAPIEVFFTKSGPIDETTCTRLYQDLEVILDYVAAIPQVDTQKICIVALSLSGYLAAKLAQRDPRVSALIMVDPPFNVIEMLDNFRRHHLRDRMHIPTFGDFLKGRPNMTIADWDQHDDYCNYFEHVVRSCHLVDIAVTGPREFGRDRFLEALADITRSGRRVALVYAKDDPIVNPEHNIHYLTNLVAKGHIRKENMYVETVSMAHFYPERGSGGEYPLRMGSKTQIVREMSAAIGACWGEVGPEGPDGGGGPDEEEGPTLTLKTG
jgi:hypothetical protein